MMSDRLVLVSDGSPGVGMVRGGVGAGVEFGPTWTVVAAPGRFVDMGKPALVVAAISTALVVPAIKCT